MSTSREGLRLRHEDAEIVLELCLAGELTRGSIASFSTAPGYLFADGFE